MCDLVNPDGKRFRSLESVRQNEVAANLRTTCEAKATVR